MTEVKEGERGQGFKGSREKKTDFENETQQNLMKIVEFLATDVFRPTGIKDIEWALGLTYNKVLWALHNLKIRGWAEQVADGWRLSPRIVKIADSVRQNLGENLSQYLGK